MTRSVAMARRVGLTVAVALAVPAPGLAWPHPVHPRYPRVASPHPGAPQGVSLVRTEFASPRDARDTLALHTVSLLRCVTAARLTDPVPLGRIRALDLAVHLQPTGQAESVDIDPPGLPRGLSRCLGSVLLAWHQGGSPLPGAAVYLRLELPRPQNTPLTP